MNAGLHSGELDRRVTITSLPSSVDALGQPTGSATTVGTWWAKYTPTRGRHIDAAGREVEEVIDIFTLRYTSSISQGMLLAMGSVNYEIDRVEEIGRGVGLKLTCRRVT